MYTGNNQETTPELTEPQLTDGQTDNLPPVPEYNEQAEQVAEAGLPNYSQMTMNSGLYSQEEFNKCFNDFLTFLKSPEVAADAFGNIHGRGQAIAAQRVYEMAHKYRFLRFLIDKNAHLFGDLAIVSLWATIETNAILLNWTGINYLQKAKIWLNEKIKQKAAQSSGKRKGWGFLGRQAAEKQPKQEN